MVIKKRFLLLGMILLMFVVVTACSYDQEAEEPATGVPAETEQPTDPPTLGVTPTAEIDEPTQEPEETEDNDTEDAAFAEQSSACIECHTDQAMLIESADPVEEVESENEGAG